MKKKLRITFNAPVVLSLVAFCFIGQQIWEGITVKDEIWKKENRKTITVDFVMRIPKEVFEKWYEQQDVYKKADKMPTILDMEKDYIRFEEAAMLLDVMESEMLKLIRTSAWIG